MKSLVYLITILAFVSITSGCKEIIAEDISNRTPVIIIPFASDTVQINPVHFKWEVMPGATKYHLQVVSPSFSTISDYVLDTIITGTDFYFPLDSNVFELKLTALNGGYVSQTLGPIQFWVGLSPSVNTSFVTLTSPVNNIYLNNTFTGPFNWQSLSSATSYEFSLRKGSSFAAGTIEHTQNNIATNTYTLPGTVTITEGTYYWGVKAYFSSGETYFATRAFQVDSTDPNTPTLISPTSLSLLNAGSISFDWTNGTDSGTIQAPIHSIIEIATDAGFTNIAYTANIIGISKSFIVTAGTYYWRVYNLDDAGNTSSYSTVIQIVVN